MKYNDLNIKIDMQKAKDCEFIKECEKIALDNHVTNGGTIRFLELYKESDYIVIATINQKVIGYTYLSQNFILDNDLYIEQIAVKKDAQSNGIGTKMIEFVCATFNEYKFLTANVNPNNIVSLNFNKKNGFEVIGQNEYGLSLCRKI